MFCRVFLGLGGLVNLLRSCIYCKEAFLDLMTRSICTLNKNNFVVENKGFNISYSHLL